MSQEMKPDLDALLTRILNRRVVVEQQLFDMAAGKLPMPDANKLRELAMYLGDPTRPAIAPQPTDFAVAIAQRKWDELKDGGHKMTAISFDGPRGSGTICPWGRVAWNQQPVPQPVAQGWQPIETAPKDGSMFLCWVAAERWTGLDGESSSHAHDTSQVDFCWWRNPPEPPAPEAITGGYFDNAAGQIGDGQDITHWMPLPAAPGAASPSAAAREPLTDEQIAELYERTCHDVVDDNEWPSLRLFVKAVREFGITNGDEHG